jgi:hypothetical protein
MPRAGRNSPAARSVLHRSSRWGAKDLHTEQHWILISPFPDRQAEFALDYQNGLKNLPGVSRDSWPADDLTGTERSFPHATYAC